MAALYFDLGTLSAKADELEALNNSFYTEVDNLNSTEEALAGMWEGDAKDAFRNAYRTDSIQMHNFYNAIKAYVQALREIIAYYAQKEAENVQIAQNRTY